MGRTPLPAVTRSKPGGDTASAPGHGLMAGALLTRVIGRQGDALNPDPPAGQQVVDVPVFSRRTADVAEHAGAQGAGGPAGVNVKARREAEAAEPTDRHAQVN